MGMVFTKGELSDVRKIIEENKVCHAPLLYSILLATCAP